MEQIANPEELEMLSPDPVEEINTQRLEQLEAVIQQGLNTFVEVGTALLEIRDSRLYRNSHSAFEDYLRERWDMSKSHANRLIDAATIVQNLTPIGVNPTHESQVRPLASLDPEQQREAWEQATAENANPTAEQVSCAARIVLEADVVEPPVPRWEKDLHDEPVPPPPTPSQPRPSSPKLDNFKAVPPLQESDWRMVDVFTDNLYNQLTASRFHPVDHVRILARAIDRLRQLRGQLKREYEA